MTDKNPQNGPQVTPPEGPEPSPAGDKASATETAEGAQPPSANNADKTGKTGKADQDGNVGSADHSETQTKSPDRNNAAHGKKGGQSRPQDAVKAKSPANNPAQRAAQNSTASAPAAAEATPAAAAGSTAYNAKAAAARQAHGAAAENNAAAGPARPATPYATPPMQGQNYAGAADVSAAGQTPYSMNQTQALPNQPQAQTPYSQPQGQVYSQNGYGQQGVQPVQAASPTVSAGANQDADQPAYPSANQYAQPAAAASPYPGQPTPQQAGGKNIVGIIGLAIAVLGFILACIPPAMFAGWMLLPIGFILGIVGLVLPNKPKGTAIAALVVSIIGTIVAAVVLVAVIAQDYSEDVAMEEFYNEADQYVYSDDSFSAAGTTEGTSRDNPLAIGDTAKSGDWEVTLNSVDFDATESVVAGSDLHEQPADDMMYLVANVTVKYTGDDPQGELPVMSSEYVAADGNSFDAFTKRPTFDGQLSSTKTMYEGGENTGDIAILVPKEDVEKGTFMIWPDPQRDRYFFELK